MWTKITSKDIGNVKCNRMNGLDKESNGKSQSSEYMRISWFSLKRG